MSLYESTAGKQLLPGGIFMKALFGYCPESGC